MDGDDPAVDRAVSDRVEGMRGEGLPDARVELRWNAYDTGLFTEKLYRHVQRGEVAFDLQAGPGSLHTRVALDVSANVTVDLIGDVGRYLLKRREVATGDQREAGQTHVIVVVDGVEYGVEVDEEADVAELRRLAMRKGEGEQATLADF